MENLERYKGGKITYGQLVKSDIALWGHVRLDRIKNVLQEVPIMPGVKQTFDCLRNAGFKTALISAGISIVAERLQAILKLDHIFANEVLTDRRGFLTGEGLVTVGLLDKLKVLNRLSITEGFSLAECAVVGDSSYDIPMFKKEGLSIAFNSDEENVQKSADVFVEKKNLREILSYLIPDFRLKPCRI